MTFNILLIEENEAKRAWLTSTFHVAELNSVITSASKLTSIHEKTLINVDLLVIEEQQFAKAAKRIGKVFSHYDIPFPFLVLTPNFGLFDHQSFNTLIIDSFPKLSLTPPILTHICSSLLRDFDKDSQLKKLAHFDELTNATNRHLFHDRVKQALLRSKRFKEPLSLLFFDLDKFKEVNDLYGHETGDELLRTFVRVIKQKIRQSDTLGRLGGDEFALLLPKTSTQVAKELAEKIISALSASHTILNHQLSIFASIGITGLLGHEAPAFFTVKSFINAADIAVYQAKTTGRNKYVIHLPDETL